MAYLVLSYLTKNNTSVLPHPPYSAELAPKDFFLYPQLKMTLKELAKLVHLHALVEAKNKTLNTF
ncbi:hypothetical protein LAZ67_3004792 [Cordylochernes scorpioides]|uniref:Histone-lysine N-methyltransferase SETMAR n=1 Tax=Cordylochernes scorpioides TaxID=51811 RepID=A0ABY6KCL0_9ARAC|nr:hypothetical protein LAZ67_3004792 [Cordylochernes scorpioides]